MTATETTPTQLTDGLIRWWSTHSQVWRITKPESIPDREVAASRELRALVAR